METFLGHSLSEILYFVLCKIGRRVEELYIIYTYNDWSFKTKLVYSFYEMIFITAVITIYSPQLFSTRKTSTRDRPGPDWQLDHLLFIKLLADRWHTSCGIYVMQVLGRVFLHSTIKQCLNFAHFSWMIIFLWIFVLSLNSN